MKRKLLPVIVLGLVLLSAAAALADGDIYVGGPWGTKITSLPYEIKTPGSYYLGSNLSYAGPSHGITISHDDVTLDLMGFSLNYTGTGSPSGIYMNGRTNVEIRNGTVSGWGYGIQENDNLGLAHRIINVRAVGNANGILLGGTGHLVKGCEARATGNHDSINIGGAGTVTGCTANLSTATGINISYGMVSSNVVIGSSNAGRGIYIGFPGSVVRGNKVSGCGQGITPNEGAAVIDNTVDTASTTTGIALADVTSNVLDQNTVLGPGTRYSPSTFSHAAVRNNNN